MADFKHNFSLRGAVDLENLKHHVDANDADAPRVIPAGKYVVDTTQDTFETMVQTSVTFPIVVVLWVRTDERLIELVNRLTQAVNAMDGAIQLSRIDIAENPLIAQTLRVQGAPAMFGLIAGRPMPILQGLPREGELQQLIDEVLPKLVDLAHRSGVNGTAPYVEPLSSEDPQDAEGGVEGQNGLQEQIPQGHEQAYALAQQGQYELAAQEYARILQTQPSDAIARRERAKALLLARSGMANVREVRTLAGDHPSDVHAQLAVADIDMIGGQVTDAFNRLLDLLAELPSEDRDELRQRLLEYFDMFDASDPRVKSARRRLATLLY